MTKEELKNAYAMLYDHMASSGKKEYMMVFGRVMTEMMHWFIENKPEQAEEWLEKLSSIEWKNYVTEKEAERIVASMEPEATWSRKEWSSAMESHKLATEQAPCYNRCALWVTMNMIMSDSSETLKKYTDEEQLFSLVHDLAVDKLTDKDGVFKIRKYFDL